MVYTLLLLAIVRRTTAETDFGAGAIYDYKSCAPDINLVNSHDSDENVATIIAKSTSIRLK